MGRLGPGATDQVSSGRWGRGGPGRPARSTWADDLVTLALDGGLGPTGSPGRRPAGETGSSLEVSDRLVKLAPVWRCRTDWRGWFLSGERRTGRPGEAEPWPRH
jgi:hypothetical protein